MKCLCDEVGPDAEVIRVVLGDLNTRGFGPRFAAFPPGEAWRLRRTREFHDTPKHAGGLSYGRVRVERPVPAVPGPADRQPGGVGGRGGGVAGARPGRRSRGRSG